MSSFAVVGPGVGVAAENQLAPTQPLLLPPVPVPLPPDVMTGGNVFLPPPPMTENPEPTSQPDGGGGGPMGGFEVFPGPGQSEPPSEVVADPVASFLPLMLPSPTFDGPLLTVPERAAVGRTATVDWGDGVITDAVFAPGVDGWLAVRVNRVLDGERDLQRQRPAGGRGRSEGLVEHPAPGPDAAGPADRRPLHLERDGLLAPRARGGQAVRVAVGVAARLRVCRPGTCFALRRWVHPTPTGPAANTLGILAPPSETPGSGPRRDAGPTPERGAGLAARTARYPRGTVHLSAGRRHASRQPAGRPPGVILAVRGRGDAGGWSRRRPHRGRRRHPTRSPRVRAPGLPAQRGREAHGRPRPGRQLDAGRGARVVGLGGRPRRRSGRTGGRTRPRTCRSIRPVGGDVGPRREGSRQPPATRDAQGTPARATPAPSDSVTAELWVLPPEAVRLLNPADAPITRQPARGSADGSPEAILAALADAPAPDAVFADAPAAAASPEDHREPWGWQSKAVALAAAVWAGVWFLWPRLGQWARPVDPTTVAPDGPAPTRAEVARPASPRSAELAVEPVAHS